jgi:multiple sugar transport system substrate-binding protein
LIREVDRAHSSFGSCRGAFSGAAQREAADLVVWWVKGFYPQEDQAVGETIAAFEQASGKQIEVTFVEETELPAKIAAALETGQPPDFAFGMDISAYIPVWAFGDRLVDLTDAIGSFTNMFDPDALERATLFNAKTGKKALYGLPIGRSTVHIHVWKNLLAQASLTLADIPRDWEEFWTFWCDRVQPAVRRAAGREDIWGIGLPLSADAVDTWINFRQFMIVYDADYVTPDGRLIIDDPAVRQSLIKALETYTAIYLKGCTPPDSVSWGTYDNNERFLGHAVVMTVNETLSIPNALKSDRPDGYQIIGILSTWLTPKRRARRHGPARPLAAAEQTCHRPARSADGDPWRSGQFLVPRPRRGIPMEPGRIPVL